MSTYDEFDLTISDSYRTPGRRKNNFTAVVAPTAADDSGDGYEVGSVWVDTVLLVAYTCVDDTLTAAVWVQGGASDHGDLTGLDDGDHDTLNVEIAVSGAHAIDRADGQTHDLTLTGDATFTLAGAFLGVVTRLELVIRQDGTGGRDVTWPGSIIWTNATEPTLHSGPDDVDVIELISVDDGVSWFGFYQADPVLSLGDLSDVVIAGTTEGDTLRLRSGTWVNEPLEVTSPAEDTNVWMPLTTVVASAPELVWDGDDSLIPTLTPLD